jgi:tetratricopeptide (TPR) repeat protein
MSSKEVMASAPLIVLLYDRTFVAGAFLEAWRRRRQYYLGLASTWLWLGRLVAITHGRGGSAGVNRWEYALTQFHAIIHYLQLSLWPSPLVFDYGATLATRAVDIVPYAVIVLVLVIGTAFAFWRRRAMGFFGIWFFAILAPSSSIVPIGTQTMAEHRMYLALVPVVVLAVLGLYWLLGRRSAVVFLALAAGLGWLTVQRNKDYNSELAIWSDTVAKCPGNERAHVSLGAAWGHIPGRLFDEIAEYQVALHIKPDYAEAHLNLGNALSQIPGRLPDAIAEYKTALRINPGYADAYINWGNALLRIPGHGSEAIAEYKAALRMNPNFADAYYDVGCVLSQIPGRLPDAIAAYQAALRINPDQSEAHYNLGCALLQIRGRLPEAITEFEAALQIKPDYADAHVNLGYALLQVPGQVPDAMAHFERALQIKPDLKDVRQELDRLRAHP